ncbi:PREDICTED: alpha-tocopherol transfer protein-like isoform X1 [Papilio xuthus]|uniref:Alpha-tocopherol transfer protein-like isoform X1 n=2 Tax=Papilio xuthus TaxID=66420 RepID=A0AAJ6Z915_PAPXU|nr:PREDICTED: alpha-tocopherol transfer protein-like isoform X1 [Papilio xuthus]
MSASQMYLDGQNNLLLYTEEDKQAVKKEIGLKDSVLEEDIDAILEWFKKEPHLAESPIERHLIEKFLVVAKGSREKTKKRIDNFYKYRTLAPELIQSRIDALTKPDHKLWTFFRQAIIPKLYDGKRITVVGFSGDASAFDTEVMYRNIILTVDLRLKYDYMFSDIWIVDLNNTGLGHLLRVNPVILQKAVNLYQESVGIRVKHIHCVNAPVFGHHVVNFMKKFVKAKMIDRVIIHDTMESLHKYVPKEYLPKDYGGDMPSLVEFTESLNREVKNEKIKGVLIDYCKLVSDESKRPREKYDEECIVGSFKKLDFD